MWVRNCLIYQYWLNQRKACIVLLNFVKDRIFRGKILLNRFAFCISLQFPWLCSFSINVERDALSSSSFFFHCVNGLGVFVLIHDFCYPNSPWKDQILEYSELYAIVPVLLKLNLAFFSGKDPVKLVNIFIAYLIAPAHHWISDIN